MNDLPQGWKSATFADVVVSFSNGIAGDQNKEGIGIPVSRIETIADQSINFKKVGYLADYDLTKIDRYQLNHGDILFSHINSPIHLGKTAIFDNKEPLYHGINLLRIVVNREAVIPATFNYFCKLARFQGVFAMRAQHAVNQSSINQKKLGEFEIPLAPMAEQKRIADKLDTVLARVDTCRERLNRVPFILKRFRQSVLVAATSGHLTADWCELRSLDQTWREPRNHELSRWKNTTVGEIIENIQAGLNLQCEERPPEAHERGLAKISAVTWGRYNDEESKTLPREFVPNESAKIGINDFLISRANTLELVGACVIVDKVTRPVYLSDKVLRLVMPETCKKWMPYCLRSPAGRDQIENFSSGNQLSMRNLSQANLKRIAIQLPTEIERLEIERRVEILFAFADRLEARLATARTATDRLTPALLAKAFRGELVPQDPNDEPAAELLKRLAAARNETGAKQHRGRAAKANEHRETAQAK